MSLAYVLVTSVAVAANGAIAVADLAQAQFVLDNSAAVGVPQSWLRPLALLKAAGATGLLLGLLGVPVVGVAAGIGLVLFFVGAVVTHLRAGNHDLAFPLAFLLLAVGSVALYPAR
ncbi:MAG TPA: DoxX family protein [Acidimicrobiales bacterium]|nr:DoxX family protein [Acidimicrobiales bacterium]